MIPQAFIEDLLGRVDLVELVGGYVRLKKSGTNYTGLCPFHAEKTPSFTVSATKQFYHCFGCGVHGTAVGFLMEHLGLGYLDAIEELARREGLSVPREAAKADQQSEKSRGKALRELLGEATRFYSRRLKDSERAVAYLKSRGVEGRIAALFALGYAPKGWNALQAAVADYADDKLVEAGLVIEASSDRSSLSPPEDNSPALTRRRWDRFRDRIMFPIRDPAGHVLGFGGRVVDQGEPKYLNSPETALFSKGRELYGIYEAREGLRRENAALVVEGYMDVVLLAQHGIDFAVATLGTAVTTEQLVKLLRRVDRLIFAFDGDAAGRKAAWKALELSLPLAVDGKRFEFLFLPGEHDPDSFVRAHGAEGLRAAMQQSEPLSKVLLRELVARHRTESAEDRSALLAEALRYLSVLPAAGLRIQIAHAVADLSGVSLHELNQLLQRLVAQEGSRRPPSKSSIENPTSRKAPGRNPEAYEAGTGRSKAYHPSAGIAAPEQEPQLRLRRGLHRSPPKGPAAGLLEKTITSVLVHPQLLRRLGEEKDLGDDGAFLSDDFESLLRAVAQAQTLSEEGCDSSPFAGLAAEADRVQTTDERLAAFDHRLEVLCGLDPELWSPWRARLQRALPLVIALDEEGAWAEIQGALRQMLGRSMREEVDRLAAAGLSSPGDRERYAALCERLQSLRQSTAIGQGKEGSAKR